MFKTHRTYSLTTGVKNNSIAVFNDGASVRVLYHSTCVVSAKQTNTGWTITLSNGGWDTISTRTVINRALEQICTASAFLERRKGITVLRHNGLTEPFVSGMTLRSRHTQVGAA